MQYKRLHCWDCGRQVIGSDGSGRLEAMPHMRQLKVIWSNGSYSESPFCQDCADAPWTPSRTAAFEAAVKAIMPDFSTLHIRAVEGAQHLTAPIAAIVEAR